VVEAEQVNEAAEVRLDLAAYRQQALAEDGDVTLQPHFEPSFEIERGSSDLAQGIAALDLPQSYFLRHGRFFSL